MANTLADSKTSMSCRGHFAKPSFWQTPARHPSKASLQRFRRTSRCSGRGSLPARRKMQCYALRVKEGTRETIWCWSCGGAGWGGQLQGVGAGQADLAPRAQPVPGARGRLQRCQVLRRHVPGHVRACFGRRHQHSVDQGLYHCVLARQHHRPQGHACTQTGVAQLPAHQVRYKWSLPDQVRPFHHGHAAHRGTRIYGTRAGAHAACALMK